MAIGLLTSSLESRSIDLDDLLVRNDYFTYGNIWTWGLNTFGSIGDGTTVSKTSPVTVSGGGSNWKQVSSAQNCQNGVKTDGTLWSWGNNVSGQLGDGTTVSKSSPVLISGGGTNWVTCTISGDTAAAIKTDGTLWTWGGNSSGSLGSNTTLSRSSPGTTAAGGNNWRIVAGGGAGGRLGAIKTDGTLWMWGYNFAGALGDGTTVDKSSPVTTSGGGTTWKTISLGAYHTAAIKTDGTLWTWGQANQGSLGDGTTVNKSSPVTTSGGGTTWSQVSCGETYSLAVKTDGTLWAWGNNNSGQLGTNSTASALSPTAVAGSGTTWKQACATYSPNGSGVVSYAIKTNGTMWLWGNNYTGMIGDGTTVNKSSPVTATTNTLVWQTIGDKAYTNIIGIVQAT